MKLGNFWLVVCWEARYQGYLRAGFMRVDRCKWLHDILWSEDGYHV